MDHPRFTAADRRVYNYQRATEGRATIGTTLACLIAGLYILHQTLVYFDVPVLAPQELLWNAIVYLTPQRLLLDSTQREDLKSSQIHAAKSEAMRRMLGLGLQKLPVTGMAGVGEGIMSRVGSFSQNRARSDAPPGLGNWDNSCYQNSVLQALSALESLRPWLKDLGDQKGEETTSGSLLTTVGKLNDPSNNGSHLWTPAKLKNMSSWQQQDAQEYFSKIMDELDKEASKSVAASILKPGLESLTQPPTQKSPDKLDQRNPLDGLLAQRVSCTNCDYSEGLSMIPFNCLTVSLGTNYSYDLAECLDEYTKLEEIHEVECAKCTVLRAQEKLAQRLPAPPTTGERSIPSPDAGVMLLPPELRAQAFQRLANMQRALDDADFSDTRLHETCQISKKARVSGTKTRQAVIGRAPKALVVHVNRSVFDESTGVLRKNYARVNYPIELDLGEWVMDERETLGYSDGDGVQQSAIGGALMYKLKAVVTHYGRHENGHYISYRQYCNQSPPQPEITEDNIDNQPEDDDPPTQGDTSTDRRQWWRLSDEDVSTVSEEEVAALNGVFMLFYERDDEIETPAPPQNDLSSSVAEAAAAYGSKVTTTDDDTTSVTLSLQPDNGADELPITPTTATDPEFSTTNSPVLTPATSTEPTTEDEREFESDCASPLEIPLPDSPAHKASTDTLPMMRTARATHPSGSEGGFGSFRAMATT